VSRKMYGIRLLSEAVQYLHGQGPETDAISDGIGMGGLHMMGFGFMGILWMIFFIIIITLTIYMLVSMVKGATVQVDQGELRRLREEIEALRHELRERRENI